MVKLLLEYNVSKLSIYKSNLCSIMVLKGAKGMLTLEQFVNLYITSTDDVKNQIELVLKEHQSSSESLEEDACTYCTSLPQ